MYRNMLIDGENQCVIIRCGVQLGTPCHRSGPGCSRHPFPPRRGDTPVQRQEAAEAPWWVPGSGSLEGPRRPGP